MIRARGAAMRTCATPVRVSDTGTGTVPTSAAVSATAMNSNRR